MMDRSRRQENAVPARRELAQVLRRSSRNVSTECVQSVMLYQQVLPLLTPTGLYACF